MIHISQEEISSRISEFTDWHLIKSQSLGLRKNNIHIITCNDGYTVQAFRNSGREKVTELSYKTDQSIKLTTDGCILFTVILLTLYFLRFADDIFYVVFLLIFK